MPVNSAIISITCSWKTTTPWVWPRIGRRSSWRYVGGFQPCLTSRYGVIMSLLTGPGRNSEMSVMMSSKRLDAGLADQLALAR